MATPLPPTADERCGTRGGCQAHRARGERPCRPCQVAEAESTQATSIRTGRVQSVRIPVPVLAAILRGERDAVKTLTGCLGHVVVQALRTLPERGEQR